jgi:hypothetical protein
LFFFLFSCLTLKWMLFPSFITPLRPLPHPSHGLKQTQDAAQVREVEKVNDNNNIGIEDAAHMREVKKSVSDNSCTGTKDAAHVREVKKSVNDKAA